MEATEDEVQKIQPNLMTVFFWLLGLYNYMMVIGIITELHYNHDLPFNTYIINSNVWLPVIAQMFMLSIVACWFAALLIRYQFSCELDSRGITGKTMLGSRKFLSWEELSRVKKISIPGAPFLSLAAAGGGLPLWVSFGASDSIQGNSHLN